jgi:DNA-binding NtrC family response regulator
LAQQFRALREIARAPIPVLILGPSGTGKELVARAVHALSRRGGRFVGVNCGALTKSLVEAELFGARRGAFTGASEDRIGLVRSSDQGTLFLDEVGELAECAQPTLLRALQEREVLSVGATKPVPVDLRLIAATHRNLEVLAPERRFREDLLARISGFLIRLPTLRERIEDFGVIVAALLARHSAPGEPVRTISPEAMRVLLRYPWPRNVRELEHCLRGAIVLAPTQIKVEHLPSTLAEPTPIELQPTVPKRPLTPKQESRRAEIHRTVHDLLGQYRGNISEVARHMGKDRVQVRRWMKMFALSADDFED